VIENKTMYPLPVKAPDALPRPADPDVVVITYGGCVEPAVEAAGRLADEEEIRTEVLAISQLSPFPSAVVGQVAERCRRVLAVEEGAEGWGFASECARALVGAEVRFAALAAPSHPIPNSRAWELEILPHAEAIARAAVALFETA
jgi:pyruvate/2-oxoglutarate/acetoin dehydrogenase E1 component